MLRLTECFGTSYHWQPGPAQCLGNDTGTDPDTEGAAETGSEGD